jgi:tRNA pseudouridine38-40 synthase
MSYCGTAYHGFQRQKNAVGIQSIIEAALFELTGEEISINGCSRTDTGVHANEYCFSFYTDSKIIPKKFVTGLNTKLPVDMAIKSAEYADPLFHARYSCKGKEYVYFIQKSNIRDPFLYKRALLYKRPIDTDKIRRNLPDFLGTHDFASFCGQNGKRENTVRTINEILLNEDEKCIKILVNGDGFLYNMVRIIVGTLLEINEGKKPEGCIADIISSYDRNKAGKTAPPEGLYLNRVFY